MALTVPLYLQYQDVLTRPEHLTGGSTRDDILNFLRYLRSIAHRNASSCGGAPGSKIRKMTRCWKRPWRPKVATSLRIIFATLPGVGLRSISGFCPCVPGSFYTTSGATRDEYDHRPITEVLACQN
jgi:hypothetical protein